MPIDGVQLATDVAFFLGDTAYDWPIEIVPSTPDKLSIAVVPKGVVTPRAFLEDGHILNVCVAPFSRAPSAIKRDRGGRKWVYQLKIGIFQQLEFEDDKRIQPATIAEIQNLMKLSEAITVFLDANRSVAAGINLIDIFHSPIIDEELLQEAHFFSSTITVDYDVAP